MKTQFWHHSWLDGEAPRNLAPHLFGLVRRKNRLVQHELHNHTCIRALRARITTVTHVEEFVSLWIRIHNIQLQPGVQDSIAWKWRHATYSSKGASGNSAQTLFGKHVLKINASSLHGSSVEQNPHGRQSATEELTTPRSLHVVQRSIGIQPSHVPAMPSS